MKKKQLISLALCAAISCSVLTALPVYAEEETVTAESSAGLCNAEKKKNGWYKKNGDSYYFKDGEPVKNTTSLIDGKLYLFDENGKLLKGGTYTVKGKKFKTDKNGIVICNQWLGKSETDKSVRYLYAQSNGIITEYELRYEKNDPKDRYSSEDWILYIDGKKATRKDYEKIFGKSIGSEDHDYECVKIYNDLYCLYYTNKESGLRDDYPEYVETSSIVYRKNFYDIITGNLWNELYVGSRQYGKANAFYGSFYSYTDNKIYTFEKNKAVSVKKKSPLA